MSICVKNRIFKLTKPHKPISMQKNNNMYYNVHQTMIHKSVYRPSSNLSRFAKFLWSIILVGQSPINHRANYTRRPK